MLFHELGHIQANQRIRGVEQVGGQLLYQLRLAHAGAAHENKADGLVLGGNTHPAAADGGGHGGNRLVLAHDMLLQTLLQLGQAAEFLLLDLAGRNLGPHLNDPGNIVHGQLGRTLGLQGRQLLLQPQLLAAELGNAGIAGVQLLLGQLLPLRRLGRHQGLPLEGDVLQVPLDLHAAVDVRVVEVHIGAGLVDKVNGLIRQEPVGDITLGQRNRLAQHPLGDGNAVIRLVVVGDALEDLQRILQAGLVDGDRLEAALQGGVLFNVLAVFVEGGGADDLDLAPGQGRLEDIGGVHAALGVSGPNNVVDLVDDQDDISQLTDLLDKALHTAFKLAPELGPGYQRRQVQQIYLLIPQLEGHVVGHNALGQTLGNGRLAHAGFADEAGVVLLAAVQNLHHTLYLLLPADDRVQLAVPGPLAEIDAVAIQILVLFVGLAALGSLLPAGGRVGLLRRGVAASEQAVQKREGGGLAAFLIIVTVVVLGLGHVAELLCAAEGLHHLVVDVLQILRGDAHFLHHLLHLGQAQLGGAFQAQALVDHLALFILPGNKDHGHIFLTFGTKSRLHGFPPLCG